MSIFVLKSFGMNPMLIGELGIKDNEGIYIETEESNIPKKYKIDKLGGSSVVNEKYIKSNTSGITYGKYFKKIASPLDFEPIQKEKFEILNDKNKKFNLLEVVKMLEETDCNSVYFVNFENNESDTFSLKATRYLTEEEIEVQEHEFKEYEKNFAGMYSFCVEISFDSLNFQEIRECYGKNKTKLKLKLQQLKSIINKYHLEISKEDDIFASTYYLKARTNFTGKHSDGINVHDKNINEIMTFSEASEKWGLHDSTLRKLVNSNKIKENIDYRKSGKVWLITRSAMNKIYGEIKSNNQ